MENLYLSDAAVESELKRCLQCPAMPCFKACPAMVSPHDFIKTARNGDFSAAAELIATANPLGEVCGLICPERFCQQACVRAKIDTPIEIPALQAAIMQKTHTASEKNEQFAAPNGKKAAIIGAGPAGIAAAVTLLKRGTKVTLFEKENRAGGALNYIPANRLPRQVIEFTFRKLLQNPLFEVHFNTELKDYETLFEQSFDAVIAATGTQKIRHLNIAGEELAVSWRDYLQAPEKFPAQKAAIIGGGAVAADCALTARHAGAESVEMLVRRRAENMRMSLRERQQLTANRIIINDLTRPLKIERQNNMLTLFTCRTRFNEQGKLEDVPHSEAAKGGYNLIILALGSDSAEQIAAHPNIIFAGDAAFGASTAVEAVASGKNAAQELLDTWFPNT